MNEVMAALPVDLILMRHPPTDVPAGLCHGRLEVPLASGWEAILETMIPHLPMRPAQVVTSPADRCARPAAFLAARLQLPPPVSDDRLRELDFGSWEGRRWVDIPRSETDPWIEQIDRLAPPEGESFASLAARARDWLAGLAPLPGVKPVLLVVTHAGVIRAVLAERLGMPLSRAAGLAIPFATPIYL
jgi:alpha-ribazole phosphatase